MLNPMLNTIPHMTLAVEKLSEIRLGVSDIDEWDWEEDIIP